MVENEKKHIQKNTFSFKIINYESYIYSGTNYNILKKIQKEEIHLFKRKNQSEIMR